MNTRLTAAGASAKPTRRMSRGTGRTRPWRTAMARSQLQPMNASSPPIPVRTAPPEAASKIGSWK